MLSPHQIYLLAAKALLDPRTVKRVYAGRPCSASTRERIRSKAEQLKLPAPPPTSPRVNSSDAAE